MNSVLEQGQQLFNEGELQACLDFLHEQAEHWLDEAEGHLLAGAAAHAAGQDTLARGYYEQALRLQPQHPAARFNLALLELQTGRVAHARQELEQLLELYPDFIDGRLLLADCYQQEDRREEGEQQFALMLEQHPGNQYVREKYVQYLNSAYQNVRAALLAPPSSEGRMQLAIACAHLGLMDASEHLAESAAQQPDASPDTAAEALRVRGLRHVLQGQYEQAVASLEQALHAGLQDRTLFFSLAWCYLATGRYEAGWQLFRQRCAEPWCHVLDIPEWNGESFVGKNILVHSEQGIGDIIFALRFLPMLASEAKRVMFTTYPDVLELLRHEESLATVIAESEPAASDEVLVPDYQVRLMDLPGRFATRPDQMPEHVPYLSPSADKLALWKDRLGSPAGLRVGMVWAGNARQIRDVHRSTRLQDWHSLACVPGVEWLCLQKGPAVSQLCGVPPGWNIRQFDADIQSFADTAAIIAELDLVITVCTSVAHLAGAMGREVWVLVTSTQPDFRWQEGADRTHWYPTARLFRQAPGGSWAQLIENEVLPALVQRVQQAGLDLDDWSRTALDVLQGGEASRLLQWPAPAADSGTAACLSQRLRAQGRLNANLPLDSAPLVLQVWTLAQDGPRTLEAVKTCLQRCPEDLWPADFYVWLCQLAIEAGDLAQALSIAADGLRAFPDLAELHYQRGRALWRQAEAQPALQAFARATELDPRHVDAFNNLGYVRQQLGLIDDAANAYQRAVQLDPGKLMPWTNLAMLASSSGSCDLFALACWQRVGQLDAGWVPFMQQGVLLHRLRRYDEALPHFQRAVQLAPQDAINHQNLAACWRELGEEELALAAWRRSAELNPASTDAWMAQAWILLSRGDMQRGWQAYARALVEKGYALPRWDGSPLAGRSLLVVQDQGYGDLFQFAHLVGAIDGKVTLAVNHAAVSLLQEQGWPFPVMRIDDVDWEEGGFDCYVEQMRLPALMQIDLLQAARAYPYLQASAARRQPWVARLQADAQQEEKPFKVGFVWSGSSRFKGNATRSTHLSDWLVIKKLAGVQFYSLQKDQASNQAFDFPDLPMINLGAECQSFADTAAVMMELDLVISTCTAVAHLAAALGRPTWVLLTSDHPDWRWLREREDCPWYPSVRLFRQQPGEPWAEVLQRVMQQLVMGNEHISWIDQ